MWQANWLFSGIKGDGMKKTVKTVKKEYAIWIFVLLVFVFYLSWALAAPFDASPDESMRYQIVEFIVKHGTLPDGRDPEIRNANWGISYIEGGTAVSGELDAFAGVVNAEEETTEKRYGRTDGRILLTYEDEDGNSYEETSDIVLTIQPLKIEEKNTDKNEKESNKIGRQFLSGVTAVVGLGIVGVVLPGWIRRRKQGQFYE